jgi:hypothetical protein
MSAAVERVRQSDEMNDSPSSLEPYWGRLDRVLIESGSVPAAILDDVVRSSRGAFPTIVVERLAKLGLLSKVGRGRHNAQGGTLPGVELHPLDFEWYFAPSTADEIAHVLADTATDLLFMGAPTVATSPVLAESRSILIDRNPLLRTHWPEWPGHVRHITHDLRSPVPSTPRRFSAAFFDAPWYPDSVLRWLQQASRLVRRKGLLGFALFPELVRPDASEERRAILQFASELGRVEVFVNALAYSTPIFELEAMRAAGVDHLDDWRQGDLVVVENRHPFHGRLAPIQEPDERWDTYVIDRQVIKLRRAAPNGGEPLLPIEGCGNYVLPTVSGRDPRRAAIDLWTSRNRVARVGDRRIVANILDHFGHFGLDESLPTQLPERHAATAARLLQILA